MNPRTLNANQAAYPLVEDGYRADGLTKRELFAALALAPLITSALENDHKAWEATAEHAVIIADALLAELERTPTI